MSPLFGDRRYRHLFPSTTTTAIDARLPVQTAAWKLLAVLLGGLPVTVPSDGRVHKLGVEPYSRLAEANRFLLSTAAADKRAFMIYIFNTFPAQRPLPFVWRSKSVMSLIISVFAVHVAP